MMGYYVGPENTPTEIVEDENEDIFNHTIFMLNTHIRLCSHDAGTARKRHEKVTFSLSVHTMPVRNCTIPSLLPSQNIAGF